MNARERILEKLRGSLKGNVSGSYYHETNPMGVAPIFKEGMIERFINIMVSCHTQVERVTNRNWVERLNAVMDEKGVRSLLYAPDSSLGGELQNHVSSRVKLVPFDRPVESWKSEFFNEIDASITTCLGGIAETGSLILAPSQAEPRSMSLVPSIHFVVLDEKKMFGTFSEAIAFHGWQKRMPTNLLLVSGPSKTADIRQTLAYGAHGPRELVLYFVSSR
ncbi:MAG: lactate utilization protein C [Oligoflexales bacterium]|nr:lactate utilization protein C [Oligoflexales bacterium]